MMIRPFSQDSDSDRYETTSMVTLDAWRPLSVARLRVPAVPRQQLLLSHCPTRCRTVGATVTRSVASPAYPSGLPGRRRLQRAREMGASACGWVKTTQPRRACCLAFRCHARLLPAETRARLTLLLRRRLRGGVLRGRARRTERRAIRPPSLALDGHPPSVTGWTRRSPLSCHHPHRRRPSGRSQRNDPASDGLTNRQRSTKDSRLRDIRGRGARLSRRPGCAQPSLSRQARSRRSVETGRSGTLRHRADIHQMPAWETHQAGLPPAG